MRKLIITVLVAATCGLAACSKGSSSNGVPTDAGRFQRFLRRPDDVALGGDSDPVAEYRAPSIAIVTAMANAVTPKLLALAG